MFRIGCGVNSNITRNIVRLDVGWSAVEENGITQGRDIFLCPAVPARIRGDLVVFGVVCRIRASRDSSNWSSSKPTVKELIVLLEILLIIEVINDESIPPDKNTPNGTSANL